MRKLYVLGSIAALAGALPAAAAERCSIHPAKGMSDAQLTSLATLSQAEAERIAVTKAQGKAPVSIASAELEAEHGCLIWSIDVRVEGNSGIQEIQVDAGTGKVLSVRHENPRQEAAEASKEKAASPKK
jgi:hypothetical protein